MQKEPILRIENVAKSYYGVKALKGVSFNIYKGEIVGLLGANGAGKSTLLKIIGGVEKCSEGRIFFNNNELINITPHIAQKQGIITVYQELNLFSNMTVAENLFIGREYKSKLGTLDWQVIREKAKNILKSLGLDISPDEEVCNLSVAQQHLVEIARAISEEPQILLLDEPTAALSEKEINWLFSRVRELVQKGTTVVFVSHRLDEVTELCERCVILRDGNLAHELSGVFNKDTIVNSMIGHKVELLRSLAKENNNEVVFECKNLTQGNKIKDISFKLKKGEILGIAGLVGAGRTELLRTIFGVDKRSSGTMLINGKEVNIKNPKDAMSNGIALVPEDRKLEGLFLEENVRFNIAAATLEKRTSKGMINERAEKMVTSKAAIDVQLDTSRMEHLVKLLSGGNQQKSVIAKTLLVNSDVLLLDEPTRGVDIGAREEIYEIIKELVNQGKSIVLVSSDWEELIYLSDRMLVMSEGRITGELTADEVNEEAILNLSTIADIKKEEGIAQESSPVYKSLQKIFQKNPSGLAKNNLLNTISTFYRDNNTAILVFILIGLIALGIILNSSFRSWINVRNIMGQSVGLLLLTIGQLIVIISGGLDLSSGALVATSSVLGVTVMLNNPDSALLGVAIMLLFGLIVGTLNALMIIKAKVDSFVVTLGMSIILTGVALVITPKPIGPAAKILRNLSNKATMGIPNVLIIILVLVIVFTILLKYTALGRRLYAVGENAKGSYWAGLAVERTQIISYILSSLMATLAAIYLIGRTGAADPAFGPGMELDAIAAALIGGALLGGGRGKLGGAICGVFVLAILENILSLMQVELWYQEVIEGVLLLAIIISYELRIKRRKLRGNCVDTGADSHNNFTATN